MVSEGLPVKIFNVNPHASTEMENDDQRGYSLGGEDEACRIADQKGCAMGLMWAQGRGT